jgi:hypothetical protein
MVNLVIHRSFSPAHRHVTQPDIFEARGLMVAFGLMFLLVSRPCGWRPRGYGHLTTGEVRRGAVR